MKAIIQTRYGAPKKTLRMSEIKPPIPTDDQVLVRVQATSVHADVWHVITGVPYLLRLMGGGFRAPKNPVPGTDLAGEVVAIGKGVTRFKVGDSVFGESSLGMQWRNGGTFAEYAAVPEAALALKPKRISFEQAATLPTAGYITLHNLGNQPQPGQRVLINGAAGGVGSIAVQVSKARGATVTGVDRTERLEYLRDLGADHVIDYTREEVFKKGDRYDLIFDVASNLSFLKIRHALSPTGTYVLIGHDHYGRTRHRIAGSIPRFLGLALLSLFSKQLPKPTAAMPSKTKVMAQLAELIETGTLTSHVGKVLPLSEVQAALSDLQAGNTQGRIVLKP